MIIDILQQNVAAAVKALYDLEVDAKKVNISPTRKEYEGSYTIVVFPYTRVARKKPEAIGEELGQYLLENVKEISAFNVVKGFLNLSITDAYWGQFLEEVYTNDSYGYQAKNGQKAMVEFSSPNTNKPLHLGHIRNILLGWSTAKILKAAGYDVTKVQIINDRGIAICKSMLAWKLFADGATPETAKMKGDQLVGYYYVLFGNKMNEEYAVWQQTAEATTVYTTKKKENQEAADFFKAYKNDYFNEYSALGKQTKAMLLKWEAGDEEVRNLWKQMNGWVYQGFESTYNSLGVDFDKLYYESNTYLLGKEAVAKGLENDVFYTEKDGSVWIDLEDAKLDKKIVLRSDGTSVYITQDIGTAQIRYDEFKMDKMVYVVGNEQAYHFKVLFEILKRLGASYAEGLHHLSYGMVDLPTGRMKTREGTVVDADDLIQEVIETCRQATIESGVLGDDISQEEKNETYQRLGLGALKFFILKVTAKKGMIFNPKESLSPQGQTGVYIQYSYVRTQSLKRKAASVDLTLAANYENLEPIERELILLLQKYPEIITLAANTYNPAEIANYSYDVAKLFSTFWHDVPVLKAEVPAEAQAFRLKLSLTVGKVLKSSMDLLGINMPKRM